VQPFPSCTTPLHVVRCTYREKDLRTACNLCVGVQLQHSPKVVDGVLLEWRAGAASPGGAHNALDLIRVDQASQIRVGHAGTWQLVALLDLRLLRGSACIKGGRMSAAAEIRAGAPRWAALLAAVCSWAVRMPLGPPCNRAAPARQCLHPGCMICCTSARCCEVTDRQMRLMPLTQSTKSELWCCQGGTMGLANPH
jgi:hypothetical protein